MKPSGLLSVSVSELTCASLTLVPAVFRWTLEASMDSLADRAPAEQRVTTI
jgi:hypothetical protein